jgi:peptide/nickel transport system permease protein
MDRTYSGDTKGAKSTLRAVSPAPRTWETRSAGYVRRTGCARVGRTVWRYRSAFAGGLILCSVLFTAVFAPWIASTDPKAIDLSRRLSPPVWEEGGTAKHLLGTDHLGRDVFSRMVFGARVSMLISVLTVIISCGLGVSLGMISGYFGGRIDDLIMGMAQIQQSFPFIALAIAIVAVLGPGIENTILVLGVSGWVMFARLVRGEVLAVREEEYIEAARTVGAGNIRIMFRHILPNVSSPLIVMASFVFSLMIVVEASLSFIGLGVQPPQASWGLMLSEARNYLETAWWLPTFPGLAIVMTVLGANLLGDWLRDTLDPKLRDL